MNRVYIISSHARMRFRERYLIAAEQDISPDESDARLDALVCEAVRQDRIETVRDHDGSEMIVAELPGRRANDPPAYACIKDNYGQSPPGVVTLLTGWQRDHNRRRLWTGLDGRKLLDSPSGRVPGLRGPIRQGRG